MATAGFIGRGVKFPPQQDATGAMALVGDTADIEEAIWLILSTAPGERPFRPEFGCAIHDHVFDPINVSTFGILSYEVERSIIRWEPRVDVEKVDIYGDAQRQGLLYIDVKYRVKATNDPRNLVFPFYSIPEEAEE